VVTAEEVADVVAFLVSDAASGINGEALTVALGSPWQGVECHHPAVAPARLDHRVRGA
jgi:enoyl-[acyl-carrier-protein] reductase (NADH)